MMLALIALILRPVGFKYRSKMESTCWRNTWDGVLCFSGVVAALVFGVAMDNLILGVSFGFEAASLRPVYEGHFYQLFKPFALLARVLSVVMLAMHSALAQHAHNWGRLCALLTVVLFIAGGFWVTHLDGHVITSALDVHAPSNPLLKTVEIQEGAWMLNYAKWPLAWLAPGLGVAGETSAFVMLSGR